jgi:hypothetical protein
VKLESVLSLLISVEFSSIAVVDFFSVQKWMNGYSHFLHTWYIGIQVHTVY